MNFYLDTNFLVSILFEDAHTTRAFQWLERTPTQLLVSEWAATEFFALVQRRVRGKLLSAEAGARVISEFETFARERVLPLPLSHDAGARAAELARDAALKLSAADALHLALSAAGEHCLVTFDLRLAEAARARGLAVDIP